MALGLLACLPTLSSARDWASSGSPTPPPIRKRFKLDCNLQLGLVKVNALGQQDDYEVLDGKITLKNDDIGEERLQRKIRWAIWSQSRSRPVSATLANISGHAAINEFTFDAVGDGQDNIGFFNVSVASEFDGTEPGTRIGVSTEASTYLSSDVRGIEGRAQASQRNARGGLQPQLKISCGLDE